MERKAQEFVFNEFDEVFEKELGNAIDRSPVVKAIKINENLLRPKEVVLTILTDDGYKEYICLTKMDLEKIYDIAFRKK